MQSLKPILAGIATTAIVCGLAACGADQASPTEVSAGLVPASCPGINLGPAPAPNLTNEKTRLVHGVINLEKSGRIILLLDPAELLTRAERGLLDAFQAKNPRTRQ